MIEKVLALALRWLVLRRKRAEPYRRPTVNVATTLDELECAGCREQSRWVIGANGDTWCPYCAAMVHLVQRRGKLPL